VHDSASRVLVAFRPGQHGVQWQAAGYGCVFPAFGVRETGGENGTGSALLIDWSKDPAGAAVFRGTARARLHQALRSSIS